MESLRTVLLDSGVRPNLWNEVLSSCILALNQIPTHRSKKSPFELFKSKSIPITFFKPIGNPVAVLSNKKKLKLEPRGEFGKLIGLKPELKSYKILLTDGKIINLKHVRFLDYLSDSSSNKDFGELLIKQKTLTKEIESTPRNPEEEESEFCDIKVEEEEDQDSSENFQTADDNDHSKDDEVEAVNVVPPEAPVGKILRDRTLQVRPVKYSCLSEDPKTYKQAVSCSNSSGWKEAINSELGNIEDHNVWLDEFNTPRKHL